MQPVPHTDTDRYAKCIDASKRMRWDIDRDVLRARRFDLTKKWLPDGLSCIDLLDFLSPGERRMVVSGKPTAFFHC